MPQHLLRPARSTERGPIELATTLLRAAAIATAVILALAGVVAAPGSGHHATTEPGARLAGGLVPRAVHAQEPTAVAPPAGEGIVATRTPLPIATPGPMAEQLVEKASEFTAINDSYLGVESEKWADLLL